MDVIWILFQKFNITLSGKLYSCSLSPFLSRSFQMSGKRFRPAAMFFVFTVSAVVHEYILAICFGFFYPVLFCLFMCFGSKWKEVVQLSPLAFTMITAAHVALISILMSRVYLDILSLIAPENWYKMVQKSFSFCL